MKALLNAGLLALLWLFLLPAAAGAASPVPLPRLAARVTDLTATLDAGQRAALEARLLRIENSGKAQIALLLLPTTQPETIEQFGIRLADSWRLGRRGEDNGLIVIVAKRDRKMRIEVGYGLEGTIPDAVAKRIITEQMAPRFKQGDFHGGLDAALAELELRIVGAPPRAAPASAAPPPPAVAPRPPEMEVLLLGFVLPAIVLLGVAYYLSRHHAWLQVPLLLAFFAGALVRDFFASLVAGSIAFLAVFIGLALVFPRDYRYDSGGGSGGDGGGWSSSHSSDSGGGDFGGGGGDSGGGGASGDW